MAANPFTAPLRRLVPGGDLSGPEDPALLPVAAVYAAAEGLWDLLAELPAKAEATLAQRRLQECVAWTEAALAAPRPAAPPPGGPAPGAGAPIGAMIRDEVRRMIQAGELDGSLARAYGLRRQGGG